MMNIVNILTIVLLIMSEYTIVSNDNIEFVINDKIINMMEMLKKMIEINNNPKEKINLDTNSDPLQKCIDFCQRMIQNNMSYDEKIFEDYFNMDDKSLFNVINCANYLDIKELLDKSCKTIAEQCKGKSVEELRIKFNVVNDFTPEEEEQIKQESIWLSE